MNSQFETASSVSRFQKIQNWILAFGLLAACACSTGCDMGTYSKRLNDPTPSQEPVEVVESDEKTPAARLPGEGSPALGRWVLNRERSLEATRKVFKPVLSQPQVTLEFLEQTIGSAEMTFILKPDLTFSCDEVIQPQKASYRGTWKLSRDKIELNQTHRGNRPEKDYLSGQFDKDQMDLVLEKEGIKTGIVLDRAR